MGRLTRSVFVLIGVSALLTGVACGTSSDTGTSDTAAPTTSGATATESAPAASPTPGTTISKATDTEPTPATAPSPTPLVATPTSEPRPALSANQVGLFLAIHGGSGSDLLRTILTDSTTGEMIGTKNITIERDAKAVVLYLPDSEEAIVMDSYTSPSYSPHTKRPYTLDDRVFIETKYSTSLDYAEYDPSSLQVISNQRAKEEVLSSKSLYRLEGARSENPVTTVSLINPKTNEVDKTLVSFEVSGIDGYVQASWYPIAVDNDTAYWVALSDRGSQLEGEIRAYSLVDPAAQAQKGRFVVPDPPGKVAMILKFDVDDGHAVIQPRFAGVGDSHLILYDMNTGATELVDTGLKVFDVQIVHLGE